MALVSTAAGLEAARDCTLLFEAVPESEDLKAGLLRRLRKTCPPEALFLSNTSSIPIHRLDAAAGLDGRVVGFHFYNPPAIQKLLELIPGEGTRPGLVRLAEELARRFGKTVVRSRDVGRLHRQRPLHPRGAVRCGLRRPPAGRTRRAGGDLRRERDN